MVVRPVRAGHRWRSLGAVYTPPAQGPSHRSFGLTVGGVLAVISLMLVWRGHVTRAEVLGAIGVLLMGAALIRPAWLAGIAAVWSRVGHALGWFNSRVLLTGMFLLVLWPVGYLSRLFGNDPLERRKAGSMWTPYPERLRDPKHFERQF
jgi:Saxitoxin biosynthesis operon protein SxtJ